MGSEQEKLADGYYENPILGGDYPDPTVLRDGDDYYMTHSSGRYRPGLLLWHSKNLVDWEPVCFVCGNIAGDIWASDLAKYEGKYYIYFTVRGTNFVVTADSVTGPWSEPVDLKIGLIDPCHCTDEEGNRFLFFSDGNILPLSRDGFSVRGKVQKVYDGWAYPREWHTEGLCLEAPKLFKKGKYYYLTVAEGGTAGPATAHMVVSARSESLFGPWENSPYNPIVHCESRREKWWNCGHATVLDDGNGKWWMVYHAYEKDYLTLGRRTLLEPVKWTDDGWFRVPENIRRDRPIPLPEGERIQGNAELSDNFTGPEAGFQWKFFDGFRKERYGFTGNGVEISGKGIIPSTLSPGAVENLIGNSNPMTCMARDHAYEVSCSIEVEDEAEAGLLLFFNQRAFCGIGFGDNGLSLYRTGKLCDRIRMREKKLYLKIINDHHDVNFGYSADGLRWNMLETGMETSGYHHNTLGGYLSLRPGLYCIGSGKALFQKFRYRALENTENFTERGEIIRNADTI